MTREQKALTAVGSSIVVGLFLMARWSIVGGFSILVIGLSLTVAWLRMTHPKGSARPTLAGVGLLGSGTRPSPPRTDEQLATQRAELERRRIESERRAAERRRHAEALREERRKERQAEAARREAEERERERLAREEAARRELEATITSAETATDEGILAASQMAALAEEGDLDEAQRQRIYLLNKVRLKLSDYE